MLTEVAAGAALVANARTIPVENKHNETTTKNDDFLNADEKIDLLVDKSNNCPLVGKLILGEVEIDVTSRDREKILRMIQLVGGQTHEHKISAPARGNLLHHCHKYTGVFHSQICILPIEDYMMCHGNGETFFSDFL
jgi:hypothetical protein